MNVLWTCFWYISGKCLLILSRGNLRHVDVTQLSKTCKRRAGRRPAGKFQSNKSQSSRQIL